MKNVAGKLAAFFRVMSCQKFFAKTVLFTALCANALIFSLSVQAQSFEKPQSSFIAEIFALDDEDRLKEKMKMLWLSSDIKEQIRKDFGYKIKTLRMRYWADGDKTVWVLDEIGKERPITVAVAVEKNKISKVEVLAFRESRGWEVKYPFFTDQFREAGLHYNPGKNAKLDSHIDGITGATLSVRAVKKVSAVALFLHRQTPYNGLLSDES